VFFTFYFYYLTSSFDGDDNWVSSSIAQVRSSVDCGKILFQLLRHCGWLLQVVAPIFIRMRPALECCTISLPDFTVLHLPNNSQNIGKSWHAAQESESLLAFPKLIAS